MTTELHPVRAALAIAGLPAARQEEIVRQVEQRIDRQAALSRRDRWLREAFKLIGGGPCDVRLLAAAVGSYATSTWPCVRHQADPRPNDTPLQRALFMACQAADDAGAPIPGERQIRRLVT